MVETTTVLEVSSVNGELIIGVQLSLHRVVRGPRIRSAAFQDKHPAKISPSSLALSRMELGLPVVDGRTIEWAEHVRLWRWAVLCRIRSVYHIPFIVDIVELGSPIVSRKIHPHRRRYE